MTLSQKVYGRLQTEHRYYSDTWLDIHDSGWVYVEEKDRWISPSNCQYIDPADEQPEGKY